MIGGSVDADVTGATTTGGGAAGGAAAGAAGRNGTADIGAGAAESAPVTSLVISLTAPRSNPPHRPASASGRGSNVERPATGGGGVSNEACSPDARTESDAEGASAAGSTGGGVQPDAGGSGGAGRGGAGGGREGVYAGGVARGT